MSISAEREKRQKKVFTKWVNSHLRKVGRKIEDMEKDFCDGVNLALLFEVISGEKWKKNQIKEKPRGRIQIMNNLSVVCSKVNAFVKEIGIGLSYSPTQIADGDVRAIMGMCWILISKFVIPEQENLSAKKGLLQWVQRVTEPYDNVDVKNFNKSWKDGLAFNALLDQFDDELMDYSKLEAKNAEENLENAFSVAEKLGIYRLLDVDDLDLPVPDDKSVMTYVATMYKFFHEQAGQQLKKEVKKYLADIDILIKWCNESIATYEKTEFPDDLEECKAIEDKMLEFSKEKAEYANYKCNLYVRQATILRQQRNERVVELKPVEGKTLSAVHELWLKVNDTTVKYSSELREKIIELEEIIRKANEEALEKAEENERKKREEEKKLLMEDLNENAKNGKIQREINMRRIEEHSSRKAEEERKRRAAKFREEEAERNKKATEEDELRKKEIEKQKEKREEEEKLRKEKEEELRREREEFRKRVDREIKEREAEESKNIEDEVAFVDETIERNQEKLGIHRDIIRRRLAESKKRMEQEKQKRLDAERRKRNKEIIEKEEKLQKEAEDEKEKRDKEREEREKVIASKLEEEKAARQKERDEELAKKKEMQENHRTKLNEYDEMAASYLDWIIKTQVELTQTKEIKNIEEEEDEETDEDIRMKRIDSVKEAKEKVKPVLEKWEALVEQKIEIWASVQVSEVKNSVMTFAYAMMGEEDENLKEIRKYKIEDLAGKKEEETTEESEEVKEETEEVKEETEQPTEE